MIGIDKDIRANKIETARLIDTLRVKYKIIERDMVSDKVDDYNVKVLVDECVDDIDELSKMSTRLMRLKRKRLRGSN